MSGVERKMAERRRQERAELARQAKQACREARRLRRLERVGGDFPEKSSPGPEAASAVAPGTTNAPSHDSGHGEKA